MRKFLIGALILCLSLGLSGMAMADFSWSGSVEFGVSGGGDGLDLSGGVSLTLDATDSSGAWSASATLDDGAIDDGYLKYSAGAFDLSMYPLATLDNDLYDLGIGGIPANPGVKLEIPTDNFSFYAVGNKEAGVDTYNFGGGIEVSAGALTFGAIFNSPGGADSNYAGQVISEAGPLTLTGEYGAAGDVSQYYGEVAFSLAGGGSLTGSYLGGEDLSEISGEFTTPLAEKVDFTIDFTSTTEAGETTTSYGASLEFSL